VQNDLFDGNDGVSKELVEEAKAGVFVEPENAADLCGKKSDCI
jgi:hypothetical protein